MEAMARSVVLAGTRRCERCRLAPRWCICAVDHGVTCPLQIDVLHGGSVLVGQAFAGTVTEVSRDGEATDLVTDPGAGVSGSVPRACMQLARTKSLMQARGRLCDRPSQCQARLRVRRAPLSLAQALAWLPAPPLSHPPGPAPMRAPRFGAQTAVRPRTRAAAPKAQQVGAGEPRAPSPQPLAPRAAAPAPRQSGWGAKNRTAGSGGRLPDRLAADTRSLVGPVGTERALAGRGARMFFPALLPRRGGRVGALGAWRPVPMAGQRGRTWAAGRP